MSNIFKSIKPSQIRLNPFKTFKKWYGTSGSVPTDLDSGSLYLKYEGVLVTDLTQLSPPYSQATNTTTNGKLKGAVFQSVDHLFYRTFYTDTKSTFGSGTQVLQDRFLYDFVTLISLPQKKVGEGILPGSVKLKYKGLLSGSTASSLFPTESAIVDDLNGNLVYSTDISSTGEITTFYDFNNNSLGLPYLFGSTTSLKKIDNQYHVYKLESERAIKDLNQTIATRSYDTWKTVLPTTTTTYNAIPVTSSRGIAYSFVSSLSSSISIAGNGPNVADRYNFLDQDYTIGFYLKVTGSSDYTGVVLEKKNTQDPYAVMVDGTVLTNAVHRYPYSFRYAYTASTAQWSLTYAKSDGGLTQGATIPNLLANVDYFVWFYRSGSNHSLNVVRTDGYPKSALPTPVVTSSAVSITAIQDKYTINRSPIYIGTDSNLSIQSTFTLDGLSMYNRAYSETSPEYLFQLVTANKNTLNVGNVFYTHGLLALTNTTTYNRTSPYSNIYPQDLEYRSTQTIYENQVTCTVGPGEFEFSNNPTAHAYDIITNEYKLAGFATASNFTPYITQIGLYDDNNNLLAVSKLSQPLRLPGNVETNFIVKFDR